MKRKERKLAQIEEHAKKCGLAPSALLVEAKLYAHYWPRWHTRGGDGPSAATMNKILAVRPEEVR